MFEPILKDISPQNQPSNSILDLSQRGQLPEGSCAFNILTTVGSFRRRSWSDFESYEVHHGLYLVSNIPPHHQLQSHDVVGPMVEILHSFPTSQTFTKSVTLYNRHRSL